MQPTVTLRKAGWTACYAHPKTGKRRQVVVESEEAGWILIKREQLQAAAEREQAIRSGEKQPPKAPSKGLTLTESFQLSMDRRFRHHTKDAIRKANSVYKLAAEFFGPNTQLSCITAQWFDEWRCYLGRSRSNQTVNRYASVLNAMRADAIKYRSADLPAWPGGLDEEHERIKPRYLSEEEVLQMIEYWKKQALICTQRNKWAEMEDLWLFRLLHGSRYGETRRLQVKDLDWQHETITFWDTKNGEPHTFPMTEADAAMLRRRCEGLKPTDTVFTMNYRTFGEKIRRTRKALKLEGRVVGHTARHTMATRAIAAGATTQQVKQWGNWKSTTSMDRYVHSDQSGKRITRDLMQQVFNGEVTHVTQGP